MKKIKIISLLLFLILLSGCITVSKKDLNDIGGFFRSSDLGDTWERKNILYTAGTNLSTFSKSNIN